MSMDVFSLIKFSFVLFVIASSSASQGSAFCFTILFLTIAIIC